LHVTRQHVAYFVLCVLIKIYGLITTFRRQLLFTRQSSRSAGAGTAPKYKIPIVIILQLDSEAPSH